VTRDIQLAGQRDDGLHDRLGVTVPFVEGLHEAAAISTV
jgi:hypothetical protein